MNNLTVLIPFRNGYATIEKLLDCIPLEIPIIVVDDQSYPPYVSDRQLTIIRPNTRKYFTGAVNVGIAACQTDVLILNQDVTLNEDTLEMIFNNRIVFDVIGEAIPTQRGKAIWRYGYIHGTFMYIKRKAINKIGLMNEQDFPMWGSTAEYQLRAARQNFKILPLRPIPGFSHARIGGFGESFKQLLKDERHRRKLHLQLNPLVSVIVPCYNYGRYLPDCLASLMGGASSIGLVEPQTLQSFEIIIVDDASTDDSATIAEALVDEWKGVSLIKRKLNGGTAACYNTGIREALGKYITILSADDMRTPESLERLYRLCAANPNHFVYDDMRTFDKEISSSVWRMKTFDFEELLSKNHIHAGIMFEKSAWLKVGGYPEEMNDGREDWAMNIRLGQAGVCGLHDSNPGYLYRRAGQGRSLTNTNPVDRQRFLAKLYRLFPDLYKGERPPMCCGQNTNKNGGKSAKAGRTMNTLNQEENGMVEVEYLGGNFGTERYFGAVSGKTYKFNASRKRGFVFEVDLRTPKNTGLLDLWQNQHAVFKLVSEAPAPPQNEVVLTGVTSTYSTTSAPATTIEIAKETVETTEINISIPAAQLLSELNGMTQTLLKQLSELDITTVADLEENFEALVQNGIITEKKAVVLSKSLDQIKEPA